MAARGDLGGAGPAGALVAWDAALDASPHALALLDTAGHVVRINRACATLFGGTAADLTGACLWEPDVWAGNARPAQRCRDLCQEASAAGRATGELEFPDVARPRVLDATATRVTDAAAGFDGVLFECRDVTELHGARRALRLSHEKFAGMFAISADAIITIDERQRIVDFNAGAEQVFGWTADEARGQPLDMLIPERYRPVHADHVRTFSAAPGRARRMGERRVIEGLRRDGHVFPAEASISTLEVDGRRVGTVVLRDVTDRVRALGSQRTLAHAGALLADALDEEETLERIALLMVDSLADACVIFTVDAARVVRRAAVAAADPEHAALLAPLQGQSIAPDESHPVHVLLETGEAITIDRLEEVPYVRDQALPATRELIERMQLRSALIVPLRARGEVLGAIGLFAAREARYDAEDSALAQELAARTGIALDNARLYREAVAAVRARDDVLAVVSHDLGNPLSAIRIGVSLLLRHRPTEAADGGWAHLAGIQQSVQQMERLIRDLLEVKRIEAGQLALAMEDLAAADLLAGAVELMSPLAEKRDMSVRIAVDEPSPHVHVDRARLLQVLTNLLGNAIKFTQEGGDITLSANAAGGEVVFSVRDNGPGIATEDVEHIFDRFWQAQRKGREGLGLGLGLAIVRGIVQAHGGRVWAESEIGVGTTISFTLPAVGAPSVGQL